MILTPQDKIDEPLPWASCYLSSPPPGQFIDKPKVPPLSSPAEPPATRDREARVRSSLSGRFHYIVCGGRRVPNVATEKVTPLRSPSARRRRQAAGEHLVRKAYEH
eukprot:scaffold56980_cov97-Phaeocystis_antarctica.AAC.1